MPDGPQQRRNILIAVVGAAVVVAVATALAVGLTGGDGDDDPDAVAVPASEGPEGSDDTGSQDSGDGSEPSLRAARPGDILPSPMSGQEAVDALGDQLERVAQINNTTVDELRELLLRDASLVVSPSGRLMYEDTMTPPPMQE